MYIPFHCREVICIFLIIPRQKRIPLQSILQYYMIKNNNNFFFQKYKNKKNILFYFIYFLRGIYHKEQYHINNIKNFQNYIRVKIINFFNR